MSASKSNDALSSIENRCALCGGALGRVLLEHDAPDRFERSVGIAADGYRRYWRECTDCGSATNIHAAGNLARLNEIAAAYYGEDFGSSPISDKFLEVMNLPPHQSDNAGRVERVLGKIAELGIGQGAPLRAVDIGAGTGVFLARLLARAKDARLEISATAIEPDPDAAAHLRSLGLFDVLEGFFDGQPEYAGSHLVTLNKVLEHLRAPQALLRAAAGALREDDGLLYVEVPDVLTIGRRPKTDNILGGLHHHLYSPCGLERVLSAAGLVVLEISRVFEPSGKITVFGFAVPRACVDRLSAR